MPSAAINVRISFFILVLSRSVRCEGYALRDRLEFAEAAPPRHQQEETEIEQGTDLRHALANRRRRLDAQIGQDHEVDDEHAVHVLVPAWTIADRLDRAVIQPG